MTNEEREGIDGMCRALRLTPCPSCATRGTISCTRNGGLSEIWCRTCGRKENTPGLETLASWRRLRKRWFEPDHDDEAEPGAETRIHGSLCPSCRFGYLRTKVLKKGAVSAICENMDCRERWSGTLWVQLEEVLARTSHHIAKTKEWDPGPHPLREMLSMLCAGEEPPEYVRGASSCDMTEEEGEKLHEWLVNHVEPEWMTGIGALEAAERMIEEAISNGNIARQPQWRRKPMEAAGGDAPKSDPETLEDALRRAAEFD